MLERLRKLIVTAGLVACPPFIPSEVDHHAS